MTAPRVVLAGGSGFLGRALAAELVRLGREVVVLTRSPRSGSSSIAEVAWDGRTLGDWASQLDGAEAVINLTGKRVDCRPTAANRAAILSSRVDSVRVVDQAIARCAAPPRVLIQAASLAIYGDPGDKICDESAPHATGYPADVCVQWEAAFNAAVTPATRRVILRIGIVLGRDDGALAVLANLTRWGLGGTVGNGRQYISWIHHADFNRLVVAAIERDDIDGAYNATGPTPVTNREFMATLRKALHRPWTPPAPAWVVRVGAWLMGSDGNLALGGRRCVPGRLVGQGFGFEYQEVGQAMGEIFGRDGEEG